MRLYILAMENEAKDIIKDLRLVQNEPFKLYKTNKTNNLVVISGIGKVNASLTLTAVINNYKIDQIINIGFAGALGNYKIGEVVNVDFAKYHDFDLSFFGYEKGQVPNMPVQYKSANDFMLQKTCKNTTLYTGDYFMKEPLKEYYLADMEGAALFQVAHLYNVKISSIKVVSDIIGLKQQKEVYNNFEKMGSKYILDVFNKLEEE